MKMMPKIWPHLFCAPYDKVASRVQGALPKLGQLLLVLPMQNTPGETIGQNMQQDDEVRFYAKAISKAIGIPRAFSANRCLVTHFPPTCRSEA